MPYPWKKGEFLTADDLNAAIQAIVVPPPTPATPPIMQHFDTIASLRANIILLSNIVALVDGYYTPNDGGNGLFVCVPTDTSTLDNGGAVIVDGRGQRWYRQWDYVTLSTKEFGAKSDGVTDDSARIQTLITFLQSGTVNGGGKGGRCQFPIGITLINAGITVSEGGITLTGAGWEEFSGLWTSGVPGTQGTIILTTVNLVSTITLASNANNVTVRDMGFRQLQPANTVGWTPTVYPPTISILGNLTGSGSKHLENLFCWNCYEFIRAGSLGNAAARNTMRHIFGMPLFIGINMIFCADVNRIMDIHFWQFDSAAAHPHIVAWIGANGTAVRTVRSDNFNVSDFFCYGYALGFHFQSSTDGASQAFQMTNVGIDNCLTGLLFDDTNGQSTGSIVNLYTVGHNPPVANVFGMQSVSNGLRLDIVNYTAYFVGSCAVGVSGTNNDVSITNLTVQGWSKFIVAPAINVTATNTLSLSGRIRLLDGGAAPTITGVGTINQAHAY